MKKLLKICVTIGLVILLICSVILYLSCLLVYATFELLVNFFHGICSWLDNKGENLYFDITGEKIGNHDEFSQTNL